MVIRSIQINDGFSIEINDGFSIEEEHVSVQRMVSGSPALPVPLANRLNSFMTEGSSLKT